MKQILPMLFININILNILDKSITYAALSNPNIHELNPIVKIIIDKFGTLDAMIIYTIFCFMLLSVFCYIINTHKTTVEKYDMSPETIFISLNIIFYFVILNNIYQVYTLKGV